MDGTASASSARRPGLGGRVGLDARALARWESGGDAERLRQTPGRGGQRRRGEARGRPARGDRGPETTGRHSSRVGGVWRVLCRVPPRPDVCLQGYAAVTRGLGPGDKSRPGDNSADPGESWKKIN